MKKKKKNTLPVLESDIDLLKAFEKKDHPRKNETRKDEAGNDDLENIFMDPSKKDQTNKHGVKVLSDLSPGKGTGQDPVKEDFSQLLEESFKKGKAKPVKKPPSMPIKKRLKRYPPVEVELDLHGFTTIGAQVKTRSFINTCKHQGIFTIRIIVGKGLHSDCGPVLPDVVEDVVRQMKKQDLVLFYEWDKKKRMKSGALIVYIKQFERFD